MGMFGADHELILRRMCAVSFPTGRSSEMLNSL